MSNWVIAEPYLEERERTPEEREKLVAELRINAKMDEWLERIDGMPKDTVEEQTAREVQRVAYQKNEDAINLIADRKVSEWKTRMRQPTNQELAQEKRDRASHKEAVESAEKERSQRLDIMRRAAKTMGLTHEEYLKAFPSDVSAQELNGK